MIKVSFFATKQLDDGSRLAGNENRPAKERRIPWGGFLYRWVSPIGHGFLIPSRFSLFPLSFFASFLGRFLSFHFSLVPRIPLSSTLYLPAPRHIHSYIYVCVYASSPVICAHVCVTMLWNFNGRSFFLPFVLLSLEETR